MVFSLQKTKREQLLLIPGFYFNASGSSDWYKSITQESKGRILFQKIPFASLELQFQKLFQGVGTFLFFQFAFLCVIQHSFQCIFRARHKKSLFSVNCGKPVTMENDVHCRYCNIPCLAHLYFSILKSGRAFAYPCFCFQTAQEISHIGLFFFSL